MTVDSLPVEGLAVDSLPEKPVEGWAVVSCQLSVVSCHWAVG
ncbi:hypothetical protein QUB70_28800 [Microcoleus sp. A003_D6]